MLNDYRASEFASILYVLCTLVNKEIYAYLSFDLTNFKTIVCQGVNHANMKDNVDKMMMTSTMMMENALQTFLG